MICIGVDPDLHCTTFAALQDGKFHGVFAAEVDKSHKERIAMILMCIKIRETWEIILRYCGKVNNWSAIAVEGQEFLIRGNSPFSDIGLLASVTGAVIATAPRPGPAIFCPKPIQWKGNVPKPIHHQRIAEELGIEIEINQTHGVPKDAKIQTLLPLKSDWKHGMDAIGLALWASKQKEINREFRADSARG